MRTTLLLAALLVPMPSFGQVYQCAGKDGAKVMQQMPCSGGQMVVDGSKTQLDKPAAARVQQRTTFCKKAADGYSNWVMTSRSSMARHGGTERLQREMEREQSYDSDVISRVAVRALALLDKQTLSKAEVRADLYGVCMSLQD